MKWILALLAAFFLASQADAQRFRSSGSCSSGSCGAVAVVTSAASVIHTTISGYFTTGDVEFTPDSYSHIVLTVVGPLPPVPFGHVWITGDIDLAQKRITNVTAITRAPDVGVQVVASAPGETRIRVRIIHRFRGRLRGGC